MLKWIKLPEISAGELVFGRTGLMAWRRPVHIIIDLARELAGRTVSWYVSSEAMD